MMKSKLFRNASLLLTMLTVIAASQADDAAAAPSAGSSFVPGYGPATAPGWDNALKPIGKPGPLLNLAANKKTDYVISIPATPTTKEEKAASILSFWLGQITGATFPIVKEGAAAKTNGKIISVGNTELLKKAALPEAKLDLGEEGYAIAAQGANLFLLGGPTRGPIYAAYNLLEEDLGVRWYGREKAEGRVPRIDKLSFRPSLRHFVPILEIRDPYYGVAFEREWSLHNKTNSPNADVPAESGGYAGHALFVHSYNDLVPPAQYFAEHPEFYAEVNGKRQASQLCLSNPEVLRITIENSKKFLLAKPDSKFISVSANDGRGYCECPLCSAVDKAEATVEGSKSGSLIKFVNAVAEGLAPEFPHVKVSTLAYLDTFMPPKTIRPGKNVVIQLCTDSHAWKYQYHYITESDTFQNAMKAWDAIGADIYVWDYTVNYIHYFVPMPNMAVVAENMRFFMEHGAKGIMLEGNHTSLVGPENDLMRCWVWSKQMWDPTRDTKALMKDFIYGYYGSAAEPIWQYNMMLWDMWKENHDKPVQLGVSEVGSNLLLTPAPCSEPPDWKLLSPEFIAKTTKYFATAEKLAKDPETLQRVKVAKLPLLYIKLGQGLGYVEEFGSFVTGTWVRNPDPAKKVEYEAILKEFLDTAEKGHVTWISVVTKLDKMHEKWRDVLDAQWSDAEVVKMGAKWRFKTDPENGGEAQNWASAPTNDATWSDVSSEQKTGWEAQGFPNYTGYAWYQQRFSIPDSIKTNKHLYLYFGAVDNQAEVYINGVKAFDHTIAGTGLDFMTIWNEPFAFDARPFLKVDGENTVAVRVTSAGGVRGIWKPVYLVANDSELGATTLGLLLGSPPATPFPEVFPR
jgi:hypothetical protein